MPVAIRQDLTFSETIIARDDHLPRPPELDLQVFNHLKNFIKEIEAYKTDQERYQRDVDKLTEQLKVYGEKILEAEKKVENRQKQNEDFSNSLNSLKVKIEKALTYWTDEKGIDAREVGPDHFDVIFSKLKKKNQTNECSKCTVGIKFQDGRLHITSQDPSMLGDQQVAELTERINSKCIKNVQPDYSRAVIMIKNDLINALPL